MAKKKVVKPTVKEQLLKIWFENNALYCSRWKEAWLTYKTIIGPFVKGTATYIWTLVYGSLYWVGNLLYQSGKVVLAALEEIIKKA